MPGKLCEYPIPARSLIRVALAMVPPIVISLQPLFVGFEGRER